MRSLRTNLSPNYLILIVFFIIPLSGLSIDIYVPSLPAVAQFFHVDKALVQLSVTMYMLGMGIMQLFAGAISDSFGRRQPCLIALLLFVIVTFWLPFSANIYWLWLLRFMQGCMVAMISVPMRAVMPDLFSGAKLQKVVSYGTITWSIGPIIAPALGSYLQYFFSWKATFYFLGGYSLLAFALVFLFLPETSPKRHPFQVGAIFKRYQQMLWNWDYCSSILLSSLAYSLVILFATVGPFLIQKELHYSVVQFGHIALLVGLFWFLGAIAYRLLLNTNITEGQKVKMDLWIMLSIVLMMIITSVIFSLNLYLLIIPVFLLAGCASFILPVNFNKILRLYPNSTGSANALIGAAVYFIPGLLSGFGALLKANSQLPLSLAYGGILVVCLLIATSIYKSAN